MHMKSNKFLTACQGVVHGYRVITEVFSEVNPDWIGPDPDEQYASIEEYRKESIANLLEEQEQGTVHIIELTEERAVYQFPLMDMLYGPDPDFGRHVQ